MVISIKEILSAALFLIICSVVYGQEKFAGGTPGYPVPSAASFVDVPAPTTASLGSYGNIGISYYTGQPQVSIPLYDLTVRDVTMSITLNYDASGVKINSLPSWVGQNWSLNVGGVITRAVKGRYDEWKYPKNTPVYYSKPSNYFETPGKLKELVNDNKDNYKNLKQELVTNHYDLRPDEYTFQFMGKSGKFFMDNDGNWRVMSDDNLEVMFDRANPSNYTTPLFKEYPRREAVQKEQCKTIAGFIIRDDKGTEYRFGYDRNAIEYSTNFWHMSSNEQYETWHAVSWYLTRVTDKYGNILFSLDYERGAYAAQVFNCYLLDHIDEKGQGTSTSSSYSNYQFPYTIAISSPVYLKRVSTLNGLVLNLSSNNVNDNLATEKLYQTLYSRYNGANNLYNTMASMVEDWGPAEIGSSSYNIGAFYYLQADGDSLPRFRYNPQNENKYDVLSHTRLRTLSTMDVCQCNKSKMFNYVGFRFCKSIVNNRIRLDSVMVQNDAIHYSSTTGILKVYRFRYERFEELPSDYLSTKCDHWGYYNGRSYIANNKVPYADLENVRNSDFNYTRIGSLIEIKYPTGGTCAIEYEPNDYSMKLSRNRQAMEYSRGTGGGLRVKSLKLYDKGTGSNLIQERDFSYNIPGTEMSSGELFASPIYHWDDWRLKCEVKGASYHLKTTHSGSMVPTVNSDGVSVGYTYVTEAVKDLNNKSLSLKKHVYHFSNFSSNNAKDEKFCVTFGYPDEITPYDEYSDLGFKRGKLLTEEIYDESNRKVRSIGYKYRSDIANMNKNYVLTSNLEYDCYGNSAQYAHYVGGVYKLYFPKYDVVALEDTSLFADNVQMVTLRKYNKRDIDYTSQFGYKHGLNIRVLSSESIQRGKDYEEISYSFGSFNHCELTDSILYKRMFVIQPLSQILTRNGRLVSKTTTTYKQLNRKNLLVPSMVIRTNLSNKNDTLIHFYDYTNTGQPWHYKEMGHPEVFLSWAFNDCYLMLKGNGYIPISISDNYIFDPSKQTDVLMKYCSYSNSTMAYAYNIMQGPTAIILPNGNVTYYGYDKYNRLSSISDYAGNRMQDFIYNVR
jgi:YD repeat-containing protein